MLTESQIRKAISANRYYAHYLSWTHHGQQRTGWMDAFPEICRFLSVRQDDARAFVIAVGNWQAGCRELVEDGIIGENTWRELSRNSELAQPPRQRYGASAQPGPFMPDHRGLWQPPSVEMTTQSSLCMPGRGFMFVVVDVLPDMGNTLIRKVAVVPKDFTMRARNPFGLTTAANHVQNIGAFDSPWLSSSNRPFGAPNINGNPLMMDIKAIERAGGRIMSTQEVIRDLEQFVRNNPSRTSQVTKLINTIRNIEGETLVQAVDGVRGRPISTAHNAYVRQAEELWKAHLDRGMTREQLGQRLQALDQSYSRARMAGRVGRVVMVLGFVMTAVDMSIAANQSYQARSVKPVAAETIRQVGGWGGAVAGMKVGGLVGAALGIETGPGAIITGAIGAIIFGAAGYYGADWVADYIHEN